MIEKQYNDHRASNGDTEDDFVNELDVFVSLVQLNKINVPARRPANPLTINVNQTWKPNYSVRLAHLIMEPEMCDFANVSELTGAVATVFKGKSRKDLDNRVDPWVTIANNFVNGDNKFLPPTACLDIKLDPNDTSIDVSGVTLRSHWTSIVKELSIANMKFEKSGQGEADNFTDFTKQQDSDEPDSMLTYIYFLAIETEKLETVLRALPIETQYEASSATDNDILSDRVVKRRKKG